MPASFFVFPGCLWLLAAILTGLAPAAAAPICKPALALTDVRFSAMQPETMERKWTALVSVDAARCATTSGRFEIFFTRQKENAPEIDFAEPFTWRPGRVEVSVDFWADEAMEDYRIGRIADCPCRE
jgi:hypothetical protein